MLASNIIMEYSLYILLLYAQATQKTIFSLQNHPLFLQNIIRFSPPPHQHAQNLLPHQQKVLLPCPPVIGKAQRTAPHQFPSRYSLSHTGDSKEDELQFG